MRRAGAARDAGTTLIELLVAVAILGVTIVSIVGMFTVMTSTSFLHRKQSDLGTVLRQAAEQVQSLPYASCTAWAANPPAAYTDSTKVTQSVTEADGSGTITVTVSAVTPTDSAVAIGAPCSSDPGLQKITLTASYNDNNPPQTVAVVKEAP